MITTLRTPGADPRFAVSRRGPYWRPGDSVIAEPWVALAETPTGHLVTRCGRDRVRAASLVGEWEIRHERGLWLPGQRPVVGAALVDPHGAVVHGWGHVPAPGGPSRWAPLLRLLEAAACQRCGEPRWPGCWVAHGVQGCALCLPELEVADPRPWPPDPPRPAEVVVRRRTGGRRAAGAVVAVGDDGQGELLSHRSVAG